MVKKFLDANAVSQRDLYSFVTMIGEDTGTMKLWSLDAGDVEMRGEVWWSLL
ncbi:MAG TPA: hypothetical protein VKV19_19835 [Ktedonobacteraceae bacterium]|jgi:hypothetical protein|nr:hypothetical protein [Ktedonobacteraceae bacterium]